MYLPSTLTNLLLSELKRHTDIFWCGVLGAEVQGTVITIDTNLDCVTIGGVCPPSRIPHPWCKPDESKLKYSLLGVLIHGTTNLMAKRLNASEDPHAYTKTNFKFRGLPYYAYVLFLRLCHHCYNAERATDLWLMYYVAKLFCVQLSALYFSTSLETLLKSVFLCIRNSQRRASSKQPQQNLASRVQYIRVYHLRVPLFSWELWVLGKYFRPIM